MTRALKLAPFILSAVMLTPACAAPLREAPDATGGRPTPGGSADGSGSARRMGVSERFGSLDAYLAYLEKQSHIDGAWYRQVRPGVYELQTGNLRRSDGRETKRIFTREELERKFGFSR